jgi:uncharacterized Zn finger protein
MIAPIRNTRNPPHPTGCTHCPECRTADVHVVVNRGKGVAVECFECLLVYRLQHKPPLVPTVSQDHFSKDLTYEI